MMAKKEKAFSSAKEVIKTYFPVQDEKRPTDQREGYGGAAEIFIEKLVSEFGTNLRKGLRR